ncbi:proline-rich protein 18 isoform X2 [Myotis myotis]|nr:proline-rich protein 18 isoform X2 [Myotis myotis]
MPFPPPPARAPGVPAARPSPRRPGAPRKAAAPARAPPAPAPPAAREKLRPEAPPSRSWPSATLPRPPAPARAPAPPDPGRSPVRTAGTVGPAAAARSSPRLPPEAARPAQRRHPERQLLARPRRPPLSPAADARAQVAGPRGGGDPGGLGARRPVAPLLPRGPHTPRRPDLRRALPVSLLSARHRDHDHDVEAAEEEAAAPDEGLVRRCTAWLRGVEAAAAARALDALPHLSAL